MISTKTKYVRTDGWRGYEQPINAVAGANDTGGWEDSPCPTETCLNELRKVKRALRQAGIKYRSTINPSSNVFCAHRYVVVAEEDRDKALEIVETCLEDTRLLYSCK
jgi:hypothetical protein